MISYRIDSFDAKLGVIEVSYFEENGVEPVNRIALTLPLNAQGNYPSLADAKAYIEQSLPTKDFWDRVAAVKTKEAPADIVAAVGTIFSCAPKEAPAPAELSFVEV